MTDQPYTPTLDDALDEIATTLARFRSNKESIRAELDQLIAHVEAAAEQRGAEAAILCEHNPSWEHHEQTDDFPCTNCLAEARKRLEGDDE